MQPMEIRKKLEWLDEKRRHILRYQGPQNRSNKTSYIDADNIHGNHRRSAVNIFEEYQKITDRMNVLRQELKSYVDSLDNLTDKVLFLVNIYGMSQKEVAEYLGYSHGYIRKIYMRAKEGTL